MTQATLKFTGVTKNPVKRKASPAQLAARQKFADMVRARAAAAKGKKMPKRIKNPTNYSQIDMLKTAYSGIQGIDPSSAEYKRLIALLNSLDQKTLKDLADAKIKFVSSLARNRVKRQTNPTDFFIEKFHLGGKMYAQIIEKSDHTFDMYIYQMQSTGVKGEGNYEQFFDSKNYKTKSGAMRGLEKWAKQHKYSVTQQLHNNPRKKTVRMSANYLARIKKELQETERLLAKEIMNYSVQNQDEQLIDFYHKHIAKLKKALQSGKLEDVLKSSNVKRNPSGEIGAYEITKNFKVLGIFRTKADAIKAAQGISDATGKTLAVKPVQVLAGHFDK